MWSSVAPLGPQRLDHISRAVLDHAPSIPVDHGPNVQCRRRSCAANLMIAAIRRPEPHGGGSRSPRRRVAIVAPPGVRADVVVRAFYGAQRGASGTPSRAWTGLGTPLREVTFVVLDLETTGGAARRRRHHRDRRGQGPRRRADRRVRDPGQPGRGHPAVHHGADRHHRGHGGCRRRGSRRRCRRCWSSSATRCFVAHNAPFDTGFLKAACLRHGHPWPRPRVLDTAALARRLLTGDEVANNRLGTLAAHFRTATRPTHRALDDARATVEVLHALIGRLGSHQVYTLEETVEFCRAISPAQRRKRHLADGLPDVPRASTSSATPAAGRSTSVRAAPSPPGCAATSPRPRRASGSRR